MTALLHKTFRNKRIAFHALSLLWKIAKNSSGKSSQQALMRAIFTTPPHGVP